MNFIPSERRQLVRLIPAIVFVLASVAATNGCETHSVGMPDSDASGSDAARTPMGCAQPGFGPSVSWPIPRRAFRLEGQGDANAALYLHATIDLDGDEWPDFLLTYDSDRPNDDFSWTFYRNTGAGFDPTPRRWPVPRRAIRLDEQGDASAALYLHSTFDIDGDLRPDFVVTFDSSGATSGDSWLVFRNNGSGFDSAPIRWPVPIRAIRTNEQGDATWALRLFTTFDIDGDRRADLVVTYDASEPALPQGTSWSVYRNTGSGFETVPEHWTIPVRALRAREQGSATYAISLYDLLDMDGDERPDFVRTYDASGLAGDGAWLVHRNTGHGFDASSIRWTVPGLALQLSSQGDASAVSRLYVTQPWMRRGSQDFVVTFDASGVAGTTGWLEYGNTGTGFASVPSLWPLPQRAFRTFEQGDASAASSLYATRDLDGDRARDFVVTYESDSSVGTSEWRLFRGCVR